MQIPGTIPESDIMNVLDGQPEFFGPLEVDFTPTNGNSPLRIRSELYGKNDTVEFVYLFDETPDRPIVSNLDLAVFSLCKSQPILKLERAFWCYENRSVSPNLNSLVYFFKISISRTKLSRAAAGQLPRKYLELLLKNR